MSVDELQMLTDHARRESVLKYADVHAKAKRNLMRKVIKLGNRTKKEVKANEALK